MTNEKKPSVRVIPLVEKGKTRGWQFEHRDGRKAAVVRPETIRYKLSVKE